MFLSLSVNQTSFNFLWCVTSTIEMLLLWQVSHSSKHSGSLLPWNWKITLLTGSPPPRFVVLSSPVAMAAFIFPTRIIEQHHRKLRVSRFWRNLETALINSLDQSGFMSFKWTWFNECDVVGIQVLAIKTSSGGRSSFRVALNRGVAPSWGAEYQHCRWFLEVKGPFRARPVSLWM